MKLIKFVLGLGLFLSQYALATISDEIVYEMVILHADGERSILNIHPDDTFLDVCLQAENLIESSNYLSDDFIKPYKKEFFLNCINEEPGILSIAKSSSALPRNYEVKISQNEKEDIYYIVTTLGRGSLKKLLSAKSSLKKAGTRVDHVHPLRFIGCIFSDEEMKVGILQIKERGGWVAKEFFNGLYDSLTTEANLQNIKNEHVTDFAKYLELDPNLISTSIQNKDWKGLINTLIEILPRNGNPNRYDM